MQRRAVAAHRVHTGVTPSHLRWLRRHVEHASDVCGRRRGGISSESSSDMEVLLLHHIHAAAASLRAAAGGWGAEHSGQVMELRPPSPMH